VWRLTDGEAGIDEIQQWLVSIQVQRFCKCMPCIIGMFEARAPNSPVIIVATHYDEVLANERKFPTDYVDSLQQLIRGAARFFISCGSPV
jgi:hypothetical protein